MNKKLILTTLLISSLGEIFIPKVYSSSVVVSPKELLSPISGKKIERTPDSPLVVAPNTDTSRLQIIAKMVKDEEDAKKALISKIEKLEKSLTELREKHTRAEESIRTLTASIEEKDRSIESIKEDIKQKEKELGTKSEALSGSTDRNKELEDSIQQLKEEQQTLTETLKKAEEEKTKLALDLEKEKKDREKLEADLAAKSQELTGLQGQNTELQGAVVYARLKQDLEVALKTSLDVYKQQEQSILDALKNLTKDDFAKVDSDNADRLFTLSNCGVLSQVEKSFSEFFAERLKSVATKIEHRREQILEKQRQRFSEEDILETVRTKAEKSLLSDCLAFKPEEQLWTSLSKSFEVFGITLQPFERINFTKLIPNYADLTQHRSASSVVGSSPLSITTVTEEEPSSVSTLMAGLKFRKSKKD